MYHNGCFCLASLGLGRPPSAPVRSNSFDGAHPGQPPVPCWSLRGVTRGACRHHERASVIIPLVSSCQGLTRVSTTGSTQGSLSKAPIITPPRTMRFRSAIVSRYGSRQRIKPAQNYAVSFRYRLPLREPIPE